MSDTITVAHIGAVIQALDKIKKLDLDSAAEKKYGAITKSLETQVQALVENETKIADYKKVLEAVAKHVGEVTKAHELAKKSKGPTFKWKGEAEATEDEATTFIKKHLPSSGHGNISQSLNDLTLGRGKSTPGASGVLHASAGPEQKGKGCTLFFKRDGDGLEIIAIGQHEEVKSGQKPKYFIHWSGNSTFKKDAVYEF